MTQYKGPWSAGDVSTYLDDAVIPLRLAVNGPDGCPVVASLWFVYDQKSLKCACRPDTAIAQLLVKNGACGFEVAGETAPYSGVRGRGVATVSAEGGKETLERLVDRYLGSDESPFTTWLLNRSDDEVCITSKPEHIFSWDYRERMSA